MNKTTFCPVPWIHISSRPNGDLRACCRTSRGPTRGALKDKQGATYNFANTVLEEVRNTDLLMELRVSLLSGHRHAECTRCWEEEDAGIKSSRQKKIEKWGYIEDYVSLTEQDGTIPEQVKLHDFDIRFGNLCNLKCRSCGPTESSMWYKDHKALYNIDFDSSKFDWPLDDSFWVNFERQIPNMQYIYLIGGEPMLIEAHYKFLEKCIELGHASHITLEYASNITNIHSRCFDIWKHFEKVLFYSSIDGVGKVNDYLRHPSKWNKIYQNIKLLDQLATPNIELTLIATVSVLNVYYLDDMIKWRLEEDFKNFNRVDGEHPIFSSHLLHVPHYLSIKVLPKHAKDAVAEKLRTVYNWAEDFLKENPNKDILYKSIVTKVEGYIQYMYSEDMSNLLPTFWNITNKLDSIRNESIKDSLPELYHLLKGE